MRVSVSVDCGGAGKESGEECCGHGTVIAGYINDVWCGVEGNWFCM